MRFSIATVLAFASAALAQTAGFDVLSKPSDQEKIPAGKQYEIVWAPSAEFSGKTVSLVLIGGASQPKQEVIKTIVTGIPSDSGKFSWAVDEDLGTLAVYGLKLVLDEKPETFQYSFPFHITAEEHHGDHSSAPASSSTTKSAPVTSTSAHSSKTTGYPVSTLTSSTISYGNVSSTVSVPSGTATKSVAVTTTASSTGKATTSAVATGAAGAFAANGIAVLGGLAVAVLAL